MMTAVSVVWQAAALAGLDELTAAGSSPPSGTDRWRGRRGGPRGSPRRRGIGRGACRRRKTLLAARSDSRRCWPHIAARVEIDAERLQQPLMHRMHKTHRQQYQLRL